MKVDPRRIDAFLRDPGTCRVVLLHGDDAGLIRLRTEALVRAVAGALDDPFRAAVELLAKIPPDIKVIVLDIHAEATSEKQAMGWFLDGKVSAVLGTHTHVPTADFHVLPGGTAYITDVGMTGPHDSVIGMEKQAILQKFLDGMPARFAVAEGDVQMNTVLLDVDEASGRARSIERLNFRLD